MDQRTHDEIRDGVTWRGMITELNGEIIEVVSRVNADETLDQIYDATFDAAALGSADRDEYLRVMTSSVLDAHARSQRTGQPIWNVLAGRVPA